MNTGIQDAANLGWKLAAAVDGWGDEQLLDSYHAERHPVGRQVLRSSGLLVRLALIRPRWARALRDTLAHALFSVPAISEHAAETISAIGVRYPAPPGMDRCVGTRATNIALADGRRLHDALRGGRFVVLGSPTATTDLPAQVDLLAPDRAVDRWTLIRPDGYVGWVGPPEDFPTWAARYFRISSADHVDQR